MNHTIIALGILAFTATANASDISACANDQYTTERIQEQVADNAKEAGKHHMLKMLNDKGELIGILFGHIGGEFYSAELCGSNSGYYYLEGTLADIQGGSLSLFNDEYDGSIANFAAQANVASFDLTIKWSGESEDDADYPTFTQKVWLDLTPVERL